MAAAFGTAVWLNWGPQPIEFHELLLWEVAAGGLAMLCATCCSQAVDRDVLLAFHDQVRPPGAWGPVRALREAGGGTGLVTGPPVGGMILRWLLSSLAAFAAMFALGALLIGTWAGAAGYAGVIAAACAGLWALRRWERAPE